MSELLVREWTVNDIDSIIGMMSAYDLPFWNKKALSSCFDPNYAGWVAYDEEEPFDTCMRGVAITLFENKACQLLNLAVSKPFRRQGIAHILVDRVLRSARDNGCSCVYLEVRVSNTPAISFYGKMGFARVGCRKAYFVSPLGREDALILRHDVT